MKYIIEMNVSFECELDEPLSKEGQDLLAKFITNECARILEENTANADPIVVFDDIYEWEY